MTTEFIKRFERVAAKKNRTIIGLMSGMSMDGIDLALVNISGTFPKLNVELVDSLYDPYTLAFKQRLEEARRGTVTDVCTLNVAVADAFAACVMKFLSERHIDPSTIDAIGSHGQTIAHCPPGGSELPSTLQIGAGSVIAQKTGIMTVSNFRQRDMAVGGQGAPLVPLVDFLLYARDNETIALNNLGSISNVTVVTPRLEDVIAFDTGPANMPIDFFAKRIDGNTSGIDEDGQWSKKGKVEKNLLKELLALPFFDRPPPKSAGYEEFGPSVLENVATKYRHVRDIDFVRTAVEFAAETIARSYEKFILPRHPLLTRVLISGGGIYNETLVGRIRERLPQLTIEKVAKEDARFADSKEALAFAVLANETLSGRPGNVPGATGASQSVILGDISL